MFVTWRREAGRSERSVMSTSCKIKHLTVICDYSRPICDLRNRRRVHLVSDTSPLLTERAQWSWSSATRSTIFRTWLFRWMQIRSFCEKYLIKYDIFNGPYFNCQWFRWFWHRHSAPYRRRKPVFIRCWSSNVYLVSQRGERAQWLRSSSPVFSEEKQRNRRGWGCFSGVSVWMEAQQKSFLCLSLQQLSNIC